MAKEKNEFVEGIQITETEVIRNQNGIKYNKYLEMEEKIKTKYKKGREEMGE